MLDAAKAMKLSAKDLLELNIIDQIIQEPIGGAHRDKDLILQNVKNSLINEIKKFKMMSAEEIFNERKNKFLRVGRNKGFINNLDEISSLKNNQRNFDQLFKNKKMLILLVGLGAAAILTSIFFL